MLNNNLEDLKQRMNDCKACSLYKNGKLVEARLGNKAKVGQIELMVIGEAPDKTASKLGIPFQGPLGELLDHWLRILCPSDNFVIVNAVKHFPMGSDGDWRSPAEEEIAACFPFLGEQINIYKPKRILCVGDVAFGAITKEKDEKLKSAVMENRTYKYNGIKCFVYYHPGWVYANNFDWKDQMKRLAISMGR